MPPLRYTKGMQHTRVFLRKNMVLFAVLLPLSLIFGRALFGVIGWEFLLLMFLVPFFIVGMLVAAAFITLRPDVRASRKVSLKDAQLLLSLYASLILYGFFLPGVADTPERVQSLASHVFGPGFAGMSALLSHLFMLTSIALVVWLCVAAFAQRATGKK